MPDRLILPPLRRTAKDAEAFARVVHAGQVDRAGRPYVDHLKGVVGRLHFRLPVGSSIDQDSTWQATDATLQIAWLHDVIEDGKATHSSLLREGFSNEVATAVFMWLTKEPGGTYGKYIADIAERAPLPALLVKIADTEDNADPARLALLDEATRTRLTTKYARSLPILRAAAEGRRKEP